MSATATSPAGRRQQTNSLSFGSRSRPQDPHRRQQQAIGRMAGWLFLVGSMVALPSDLVMGIPSVPVAIVLTLMGVLTGASCLVLPWNRMSERWLNAVAALATVEITHLGPDSGPLRRGASTCLPAGRHHGRIRLP